MADINVERKGPSIWPWIIGLIVLALLIWALAEMLGGDRDDTVGVVGDTVPRTTEVAPAPTTTAAPAAVEQFAQQCVTGVDAQQRTSLDHTYSINCLRQLADAIEGTAQQHGVQMSALQPQTQEVRDHAQQIEQSPDRAADHANHLRMGAMAAVAAMQTLNQSAGTTDAGGQVSQAEQAAQAIVPTQPLLDQSNDVHRFFEQANSALRSLAGTTTRM